MEDLQDCLVDEFDVIAKKEYVKFDYEYVQRYKRVPVVRRDLPPDELIIVHMRSFADKDDADVIIDEKNLEFIDMKRPTVNNISEFHNLCITEVLNLFCKGRKEIYQRIEEEAAERGDEKVVKRMKELIQDYKDMKAKTKQAIRAKFEHEQEMIRIQIDEKHKEYEQLQRQIMFVDSEIESLESRDNELTRLLNDKK